MLKLIYNERRVNVILKSILMISVIFFALQSEILSQNNGSISGKIIDKSNNEELIGANIIIVGTTIGASTDIDGMYQIKNVAAGGVHC